MRVPWLRLLLAGLASVVLPLLVAPLPTWAQTAGAPPTRNWVISVAVAPGTPQRVLAGTLNAPDPPTVFRSADGGVSWTAAASGLGPNLSLAGLAFDPQNPNLVLAADGGTGGVYRSEDGGVTWAELPAARALLSATSAVGEIYATVENQITTWYASSRFDGVLRSQDTGNTWTKLDAGLVGEARRVREVARWRDTLFAATHDGVYILDSSTTTWLRSSGFPAGIIAFSLVGAADRLYAGTGVGIYASPDAQAWAAAANFPQQIVYDVADTGRLIVAATDVGIYVGAGDAWQPATLNSAPYGGVAYAVANAPQAPRTLYVGTETDWVLRSDDEGLTFYSVAGMPPLDVAAALATPTPLPTPTATNTPLPTDTPTVTPTPTATPTATNTPLPTNTLTAAEKLALIPTATPTFTPSPTPTNSPTPTITPTATPSPTATPTPTITPTRPPIDVQQVVNTTLPPLFVGLGLVAGLLVIGAALAILRGPRDI